MNRVLAAIAAMAAIGGMAHYVGTSDHDQVQSRLTRLCGGDAGCQLAVRTHYEACFEAAYRLHARPSASRLDEPALVACVNARAGEAYFTVEKQSEAR